MTTSNELGEHSVITLDEFIRLANESTSAPTENQFRKRYRPLAAAAARAIIDSIPANLSYAQSCREPYFCVMRVSANQFQTVPEGFSLREQSAGHLVYRFCCRFLVTPEFVHIPDGAGLMMMCT